MLPRLTGEMLSAAGNLRPRDFLRRRNQFERRIAEPFDGQVVEHGVHRAVHFVARREGSDAVTAPLAPPPISEPPFRKRGGGTSSDGPRTVIASPSCACTRATPASGSVTSLVNGLLMGMPSRRASTISAAFC